MPKCPHRVRLACVALIALTSLAPTSAQAPVPQPAAASLDTRLAEAAAQHRHAVAFRDGTFSGPGWDLLLSEGRRSRYVLLGEEHGVAEVPVVARELFRALQPAGYRHLAIEVSAPMARVLDDLARGPDGLAQLSAFFREHPPGVPFFTLREEAELLVAARAMVDGQAPVLWGLDYEVMADRYLLDRVRTRAPAGPAKAAADALYERSAAAWTKVSETKNPAGFFSFSTPPEALAGLRRDWPDPDAESALALHVIEESLAINQFFVQGRNWESNDRRARLNRAQLLRHLEDARARGEAPRVLFKFGANHMLRGRNSTEVFDLGNLVSEMATAEGTNTFHLLVAGGAGSRHAVFNPVELRYMAAPTGLVSSLGLDAIAGQALEEGFTLIDLRPLRPLLSGAVTKTAHPELMRVVHGFDAILVLTGSGASSGLP